MDTLISLDNLGRYNDRVQGQFTDLKEELNANKEEVNESGIFYDANGYLYINEEEE